MKQNKSILVFGYGNPGRQDDGLGKALIDKTEKWIKQEDIKGISLDANYQLNVEDATEIQGKDLVIFADASMEENIQSHEITPVFASQEANFTTHYVSPGYVLHLCKQIYGNHPAAFLMHIKGYEWDIKETISTKAIENLDKAFKALKEILHDPEVLKTKYFKLFHS